MRSLNVYHYLLISKQLEAKDQKPDTIYPLNITPEFTLWHNVRSLYLGLNENVDEHGSAKE